MKRLIAAILLCILMVTPSMAYVLDAASGRMPTIRAELHRSIVRVKCGGVGGTGVVVEHRDVGLVVITAAHVVMGSWDATISDGIRTVKARVIGRLRSGDVAILMSRDIRMLDVVAVPILDRPLRVGERIQQCGFGGGKFMATEGIVSSATDRRIHCTGKIIGGDSGSPIFVGSVLAGISTAQVGRRGLFGRFIPAEQPVFIGTASAVILIVMYSKPVVEKLIKMFRAWRAYRQDAFPLFPGLWKRKPKVEPDITVVPEIIEPPPIASSTPPIGQPPPPIISKITEEVAPIKVEITAGVFWPWIFAGPPAGFFLFGTAAIILILSTNHYRSKLS